MVDVMEKFDMELISGKEGIHRAITTSDLSRPGIEMAGYFAHYPAERIQLLGRTELSFTERLEKHVRKERFSQLFTEQTPGIIVTRSFDVPEELIDESNRSNIPILRSTMKTTRLSSHLTNYLESRLAPTTTMHGVLVEIYGIGILIVGDSGVGKSETALELVKRGHRLVADDCVEIREEDDLIGTAPEMLRQLLEIRGLGIINVMTLFGAGAIRSHKKVSLVINLEVWDPKKTYERVGLDEETTQIINKQIPKITIPVRPGRNLAVITEVAAMNFRMKLMGVNAAEQFSNQLNNEILKNKQSE
jgi:HPr kinase/phosphorylase